MRPALQALVLITLLCVLASIAASPCAAAEFQAGVAVVDITPPMGYRMSGYFNERLNTGVKDALHAKAIVLRQGDEQAAIVFCDLIGIPAEVSSKARKLAGEKTGIPPENMAIAGTHSHTGPLYFGALYEYFHKRAVETHGRDPHEATRYADVLGEKLVEVAIRAHSLAAP